MDKIYLVYREYTDWDQHEKDNIRAFVDDTEAVLFMETANSLHKRWLKINNKVKSKRRTTDCDLIELLTSQEDIEVVERLCKIMPEYSKRWGVDSRFEYCLEGVPVGKSNEKTT